MLKKTLYIFTFLFCFQAFCQDNIKLIDYIRINDIGIKIIDKKKLKKDIDKLDLDKGIIKTLKKRLKEEEKAEKTSIKTYNAEVYKKRREEEFSIRANNQSSTESDTSIVISNDQLFAKKVDKIFDEEVEEVIIIEEEPIKEEHEIVPNKRKDYPWTTDIDKTICSWNTYYIDQIERDTIFKSKTHTVFYNKKDEPDTPEGEVTMFIVRENDLYFFELEYTFKNLKIDQELILNTSNFLRFKPKKGNITTIPYFGEKRKAAVSSDFSQQQIKGRYRLSSSIIMAIKDSKWKSISATFGSNEYNFILSKNFTGKAEKSDISSLFKDQLSCIQTK